MIGAQYVREKVGKIAAPLRLRKAEKATARFPLIGRKIKHSLPHPLTVTLTSYAPRFATLAKTLRSLLDQTLLSDHTILWVTKEDYGALPIDVTSLVPFGLTIKVCEDLKSYKKLIPALRMTPDHYLVTADDDVYYGPNWLECLVKSATDEKIIVAGRAHMALVDKDGLGLPYKHWQHGTSATKATRPNQRIFPVGVGGVLYPPNSLSLRVTDAEQFMRLCPAGDDIWFFWMARLAGASHIRAKGAFKLVPWEASQDIALYHSNLMQGGNDKQFAAMEREFGPVP